ncbi:MAG: DUF72 domain-containing protein [candidate division Zixibacteria bacterium]
MIRIGTSGWSYKDWIGNFYPEKAKPGDLLAVYATKFSTVEVDSTFYGIPRTTTIEKWYKSVPDDFKFAAKFPKKITHESDLTGIEDILNKFLQTLSGLKEKLGPLLLQFPYSFKPDMSENLFQFLKILPADFDFVVEIRNKKWLDDRFYDNLRNTGVGLALLDHPWMPVPEVTTSRTLFVRFLGDRKLIPDDFSHERADRARELESWKKLIRALEEKTDDFYGYFNNHYSGHSPTTAMRFREMMI